MSENKLVFKTDLTLADFYGLSWLMVRNTMIFLVSAIDIFLCFLLYQQLHKSWYFLIPIAGVLFIGIYFLERWVIYRRAKRIFLMADVSSEIILTLSDDGISQLSKSGETNLSWRDIQRVAATKKCYYVFLNRKQAFYFPKRNFTSQEQQEKFTELIINNVEPYKVRFK